MLNRLKLLFWDLIQNEAIAGGEYVAEDGITPYVAEDGVTPYVTESYVGN